MEQNAMMALAKELAKSLKTEDDLNNFSQAMKKLTIETALNAELTAHLGHEKSNPRRGETAILAPKLQALECISLTIRISRSHILRL